ncbi:MAG TPA: nitroreductase family protein [Candidatus Nanopelagicales bacterium]|nr:nitroreductase family protein [Candidatus Nanopelagicales bacterium]
MTRTATTSTPIHPLLAERWSPRSFETTPVTDDELAALLEAARWAPSAANVQPWRYLVGRRGADAPDASWTSLLGALAHGNQVWAQNAPLLVAGVVRVRNEDGGERPVGPFELGLSVGQLITQAHALGLHAHPMGGFDAVAIADDFGVPDDHRVVVVLAIGHVGSPDDLPEVLAHRETAERHRLPLEQLAYAGSWGEPAL